MRLLRSLVAFVVPALAGILVLLAVAPAGRNRARNLATRLVGSWGCALAGIRVNIEDSQGNASLRPAVFVFNHQSGVDPVLLCKLLRRDVVGVAKKELRRHPLLGPLLTLTGTVFVDRRASTGGQALEPAVAVLDSGLGVVIAPEGHRRRRLGRFRPGALHLARRAGVPLVPVVIEGSGRVLPPGALLMRPGPVTLRVMAPMDPNHTNAEQLEECFRGH